MAEQYGKISAIVKLLLGGLDDREKDVLEKRYGLGVGGAILTLAAIGDRYRVTRERIRQIEASGLEKARKNASHPSAVAFVDQATALLRRAGGVEREDMFFNTVRGTAGDRTPEKDFANAAQFVLEISGRVFPYREDNDFRAFWYLTKDDRERMKRAVAKVVGLVRGKKDVYLANQDALRLAVAQAVKPHRLDEAAGMRWVLISKKFAANAYGDHGLAEWAEVRPRTARDWAYLVLKKEKRPLHFTELAAIVKKFRNDKATNVQTVHNELIKDERFVLVGRGMYGLREYGLLPGTAREILMHFIRRNGPLDSKTLVKLVRTERFFKESTLFINLQNRNFFRLLPDGRYEIKQA